MRYDEKVREFLFMTKKLSTVLEGIFHVEDANQDIEITRVVSDTRELDDGCLFVFKKGAAFDSHSKLRDVEKKAAALIAERPLETDLPLYIVDDAYEVMGKVAANFNDKPADHMTNIAITGTNGKTSTALIIQHLFNGLDKHIGYIGTNGILLDGVSMTDNDKTPTTPPPIDLQNMMQDFYKNKADYTVIEATSQGLFFERLNSIHFKYRIFTNFTKDHLDFHKTMDGYFAAKMKLYDKMHDEDLAIINADIAERDEIKAAIQNGQILTYGLKQEADYAASEIELSDQGLSFTVNLKDQSARIQTRLTGTFNIYNLLAAIVVLHQEGYQLEDIAKQIATFTGISGRLEKVNSHKRHVYIDYAHTPDALENVLNTLKEFTKGKLISVFGAGGDRDKSKRSEMGKVSDDIADYTYVTSDNPRTENPEIIARNIIEGISSKDYKAILDRKEAITEAIQAASADDIIVIAGKGHETEQEVHGETFEFDDYKVAADVLKNLD